MQGAVIGGRVQGLDGIALECENVGGFIEGLRRGAGRRSGSGCCLHVLGSSGGGDALRGRVGEIERRGVASEAHHGRVVGFGCHFGRGEGAQPDA